MYQKDPCLSVDRSPHSPHNIIPALIKKKAVVLDVGCNTGFLGKRLRKRGNLTDGVDINKASLAEARKYYRRVYVKDLSKEKLGLNKNLYDYIIFSDILEHLPRPDLLLLDSKKYLKKRGQIIVSLPNIARLEIRLKLLLGCFNYQPGILGEDHLRFYTRKSALVMLQNCGYQVLEVIPTGLGHTIKILPTLFAFQFIYVCSKNTQQTD